MEHVSPDSGSEVSGSKVTDSELDEALANAIRQLIAEAIEIGQIG